MPDIKAIYEHQFLPSRNAEWMTSYRSAVEWAQSADETTFRSSSFQKRLWEVDGVSTIGPGESVSVPGAYGDPSVVDALWSLRNWSAPNDPKARALYLDSEFQKILSLVSPRYNKRRPSARLVRILCVLRPFEVVCLMDPRRTVQFRQWVEQPRHGYGFIAQNVLARQVVREALGVEKSIEDAISYSQFAWFVWELIDGRDNATIGSNEAEKDEPGRATDAPKLVMLPAAMQRKGMFYVSDNLSLLLSVVRAAENGMDRDGLVDQVGEDAPYLNLGSRRNVIAQAVSLNLLHLESGTYHPTSSGRGLLEGESPADMLTPTFVRTVFGFALILGDLRSSSKLQRGQIAKTSQGYYPRWTSERAPNALVAWMRDLALVHIEGSGRGAIVELTEAGEYWASGLPEDYNSSKHLLVEERSEDPLESEALGDNGELDEMFVPITVDELLSRFESEALRRLVFSESQLRLVHGALHSADGKRFILLAGLSGTGKTSLASAYAKAYCDARGLVVTRHYAQVSVWPDWTDPSGLLGFINPLADPPTFHETPALKLLIEATQNPTKPYFLCLDEMNLARVEHYFAPFLSAMEGREGRLPIHSGSEAVDNIPSTISWPRNLFIIGTVNMDETTHPFSDKVLDRAFTFEFWDIDLEAWRSKASDRATPSVVSNVARVLSALYAALLPARRHFGYRTCDEVLGFCAVETGLPFAHALDAAVLAKVLPKVRGDASGLLPKALSDAAEICRAEGLHRSEAKLLQMQSSLSANGIVRFWS
ncbi:hypothetical protein E0H65_14170 [Rhizobium leguminosarum bv. viciae]|nr:hypothetical protein E0H65_14170 [Rhizobium leguminosarum bv. viciae]